MCRGLTYGWSRISTRIPCDIHFYDELFVTNSAWIISYISHHSGRCDYLAMPRCLVTAHKPLYICTETEMQFSRHFRPILRRKLWNDNFRWCKFHPSCCHFDEIFVTGCTRSCKNYKLWFSQWRKVCQNYFRFNVCTLRSLRGLLPRVFPNNNILA